MKAIQFTRFGPPDVLELMDAPTPKAPDGYAVVGIARDDGFEVFTHPERIARHW